MWRWAVVLGLTVRVWGCSCSAWPSAKQAWETSPLVFLGEVERTNPPASADPSYAYREQEAWVRVQEAYQGVEAGQIVRLKQGADNCSPKFKEGERIVAYLHPTVETGIWNAPGCHRTRRLSDAADDLLFLRALPGSARQNRLSGEVELYEQSLDAGFRKVRGLAGIRVTVTGGGEPIVTTTNAEGVYELYGLPTGQYKVDITPPRGLRLHFASEHGGDWRKHKKQTIELDRTSGASVSFVLLADNEMRGRVLDPAGRPLAGACVELEGVPATQGQRSPDFDCSKEDGRFVLKEMPVGRYRLVVNRSGVITAREPFPAIYYPGTTEQAKGEIVTVADGQHLDGLDIRIPELARRVTIRGRLIFQDSEKAAGQGVTIRYETGKTTRTTSDAEGRFRFEIVAGQTGVACGEIMLSRDEAAACPHFGAVFNPGGWAALLQSSSVPVSASMEADEVTLVFPFRSCASYGKDRQ